MMFSEIIILKVGGSILSPNEENFFDYEYALKLKEVIKKFSDKQFVLVSGGGYLARKYMGFLKERNVSDRDLDFAGIASNNLNAQMLKIAFSDIAYDHVLINEFLTNDYAVIFNDKVLVAGGSKPGQSGDTVAITLALRTKAHKVFILKDVDGVYSENPDDNANAKKYSNLSWDEYLEIVGDQEFKPKISIPIDPVATSIAMKEKIEVVILKGSDLLNLENALEGKDFVGTTIQ